MHADLTVTFGSVKRGLLAHRDACGVIIAVDIGVADAPEAERVPRLVTAGAVESWVPAISAQAHKGLRKRLVIVGGAPGMAGAVVLAASAAACVGGSKGGGAANVDRDKVKAYVLDAVPADVPNKLDINFEGKVHLVGYAVEPKGNDEEFQSPLRGLHNVILTPHWSASTRDVWRATGQAMVDGMFRVSCGELPNDIVNREVLDRPGFLEKLSRFRENAAEG